MSISSSQNPSQYAPQVYTVKEVAELLGISVNLAYECVRRGELPHVRLGARRLVVPRAALHALLESGSKTESVDE